MAMPPDADGTMVPQSITFDMGLNPIARGIGLLMPDRGIGPDFEQCLSILKSLAETG
jgi:hypothetical protein